MGTKNGGKTRFRVKKQRRVNGYHIKDILDLYKRTTDIVVGHNAFALQRPQKLVVGTVYCIAKTCRLSEFVKTLRGGTVMTMPVMIQ